MARSTLDLYGGTRSMYPYWQGLIVRDPGLLAPAIDSGYLRRMVAPFGDHQAESHEEDMKSNVPHRIAREEKTLQAMIRLYCRGRHGGGERLCPECAELWDYAQQRLHKCPFQAGKTTCAKCLVQCYKADMRQRIRLVMRHAGPRMLYHHPVLTFLHFLDGRRKEPVDSPSRAGDS